MTFEEFKALAENAFTKPLPGLSAQLRFAPEGRNLPDINTLDHSKLNTAGVLALFTNLKDTPHIVLIERAPSKGVHSGQIAFPGGRWEDEDSDFQHTALRETEEEVGLPAKNIEVLGGFSPIYIPPSNFLVHPFAGIYEGERNFIPQESEVAQIIEMDFNHILEESAIIEQKIQVRGFNMRVPTFYIEGHTIWGATAMMLSELRQMILAVS